MDHEVTAMMNHLQAQQENPLGDTDLEAAWLWFAAQATSDEARRYSLENALRANPNSRVARQTLAALRSQSKPAAAPRFGFFGRGWKRQMAG
ncbi:MAG: hypothetical protein HZC41_11565 [Chloroflexi bacterium]|nr:hypothetical protein [Chloroflexota bacterium]